jgi:threonine/homoserine efflux transporter RhtA
MPISVLIAFIIGISVAMYFFLRPLQVLSKREWLISHGFIFISLALILGWLWLNRGQSQESTMLMGGIWTLFGGFCFVVIYVSRRLKGSK